MAAAVENLVQRTHVPAVLGIAPGGPVVIQRHAVHRGAMRHTMVRFLGIHHGGMNELARNQCDYGDHGRKSRHYSLTWLCAGLRADQSYRLE